MVRIALIATGFCCLLIGLVGILTPIPFGVVFITLSALILIPTLPGADNAIRRLRVRFTRFDRMLHSVARRVPSPYRRILKRTDVYHAGVYRQY